MWIIGSFVVGGSLSDFRDGLELPTNSLERQYLSACKATKQRRKERKRERESSVNSQLYRHLAISQLISASANDAQAPFQPMPHIVEVYRRV